MFIVRQNMSTSLSKCFLEWEKIGAPEQVLSWIKDGAKLQFTTEMSINDLICKW